MAPDLSTTHSEVTRSLNRSHGSFELAFAPLLLTLGGLWLDRTIDTVPVFTIVFALVGISGTFTKLYFSYKHSMAQLDAQGAWVGHTRTGARPASARPDEGVE